jgi:IS5 family transposase
MTPKKIKKKRQTHLFSSRLDQILNREHPVFVLAGEIGWELFDEEFGKFYARRGRPGLPTRLMVGLHYLKHTFNESDESVVERFVENPYWQYFCGFEYFQHDFPIDPSSMTRWRKRIGTKGMKKLLSETLEVAKRRGDAKDHHFEKVNVDTTVQEKAVAHPTDARLYQKARVRLVKEAKERGIRLRQSYAYRGKAALRKQSRYAHAQQFKRARKKTKELRNYLGRVMRDIDRYYARTTSTPDKKLSHLLDVCGWIYEQKKKDKNKVYAVHALEVECISKGKAHKRYEFGCKTSVVSASQGNWVLASDAIHGNPYDGHTLATALESAKETSGTEPKQAFVDRGYKGCRPSVPHVEVYISGQRRLSRWMRKWLKRRQAVEPVIGHMKHGHRMDRNYLQGWEGDEINAILAGCGFNMMKLYRAAALFVQNILSIFDFMVLQSDRRNLLGENVA